MISGLFKNTVGAKIARGETTMEDYIKDHDTENIKIQNKLYELIFQIDSLSANKDYKGLRKLHLDNIDWLCEVGLDKGYYSYFIDHLER